MKDLYKKIVNPATEAAFQAFLNNHKIRYDRQVYIDRCPFNKSFKHRDDFLLEDFDLYIEVKGWMSCSAVSELWWLLNHCGKDFYIYQATNEDWMGRCTDDADAKIKDNMRRQQDELMHLFGSGGRKKDEMKRLAALNRQRLKDFLNVRKYDILRWQQAMRAKTVSSVLAK